MERENEYIEYKKSLSELDDAMIDICAMLNKHNRAHVIFGILDDLKPTKIQIGKDAFKKIESKIYTSIDPRVIPTIKLVNIKGYECVDVIVEGNNKTYSAFGKYYIRSGEVSRMLSTDELFKLMVNKNYDTWEKHLSVSTINDVDEEKLQAFWKLATETGRVSIFQYNKIKILNFLGLIWDDDKHLNNAGHLLFSKKEPISLQLGVYSSDEKMQLNDIRIVKGNIFTLIEIGMRYIVDRINWKPEIVGLVRNEIPEVPIVALREIIINSFAHANYIVQKKSSNISFSWDY